MAMLNSQRVSFSWFKLIAPYRWLNTFRKTASWHLAAHFCPGEPHEWMGVLTNYRLNLSTISHSKDGYPTPFLDDCPLQTSIFGGFPG